MNVLISGSSGQIGTNLAVALMRRGDKIIGIDKRPNTWTDEVPTIVMGVRCGPSGSPLVLALATGSAERPGGCSIERRICIPPISGPTRSRF